MTSRIEQYAKRMRREMTPAETRLYNALLIALRPFEATIKAQEVVGYYIADFMIYPARVVIECDGAQHRTNHGRAYDKRRETTMRNAGIRTLRFPNWRVTGQTRKVVEEILAFCGDFQPLIQKTPLGASIVHKMPTVYGKGRKSWYNQLLAFNSRFPKR